MSPYKYPASENPKGTHLRSDLIKSIDGIEEYIFKKARAITGEPEGLLADIGAGEGRYSLFFGQKAGRIVLVEPDSQRIRKAEHNLKRLAADITCVKGTVEDAQLAPESADMVLNIHVLQHIHPDEANSILEKTRSWLKPGGLSVVCFTKKTKLDYDYNVSWSDNGSSRYGPIPKSVFELITKQQAEGALPVRKIDLDELKKQLQSLEFEILYEEPYSPRLLDLQRSWFGKFMLFFYKRINPVLLHKTLTTFGYTKFVDVCLVLRKN